MAGTQYLSPAGLVILGAKHRTRTPSTTDFSDPGGETGGLFTMAREPEASLLSTRNPDVFVAAERPNERLGAKSAPLAIFWCLLDSYRCLST